MKVLVTGATGFVGRSLMGALQSAGHEALVLARRSGESTPASPCWDPAAGTLDPGPLEGVEAVVHLAGENVATGRWTTAKKARILESRVAGTELLCRTLAGLSQPPRVLVSGSAVGFYGDRGAEALTERSDSATAPAEEAGIRVVHLRTGLVLGADGGALQKMLLPFWLGLGGPLGNGRMYMSWIALEDLCGGILHVLGDETLRGPVNGTAPEPVTNQAFTKALGKVLRRPTLFPVPAPALRLLFGEMGGELLLGSTRAVPERLLSSGYIFRQRDLESALRTILT
jgi:uncharacterized protein (TIGR01777 family)